MRLTLLVTTLLAFATPHALAGTEVPASGGPSGNAPAAAVTTADPAASKPATAAAETPAKPQALYRYTDSAGRPVYTNRPPPAAAQVRLVPYAPSPPRRPAPPLLPQAPSVAPPASLQPPPPPERTQQQALLEQLAKQIASLQSARNALKEGEAVRNGDERNYQRYLDRVQGLRDVVTRQEGVVEALQDQLRLLGSASLVE